jgi:hypothetical protein
MSFGSLSSVVVAMSLTGIPCSASRRATSVAPSSAGGVFLPGAEGGAEQDTERGGSIEVWPTDDAAVKRWEYLKDFQSSPLLGDGYDYVFGPVVLRIAKEVKPSVAEPFEAALRPAVAP